MLTFWEFDYYFQSSVEKRASRLWRCGSLPTAAAMLQWRNQHGRLTTPPAKRPRPSFDLSLTFDFTLELVTLLISKEGWTDVIPLLFLQASLGVDQPAPPRRFASSFLLFSPIGFLQLCSSHSREENKGLFTYITYIPYFSRPLTVSLSYRFPHLFF